MSYSDTSNIESLEFPFHTQGGREGEREIEADTKGEHTGAEEEEEKSKNSGIKKK